MPSVKPVTMACRMELSLAQNFKEVCHFRHIAPSSMIRVLIHRFVEDCGYSPEPLEIADAEAKENQKRKPRGEK